MIFEVLRIFVSKSIVDVVDVLLNPDVDVMHTTRYERTLFIP